MADVVKKLEDLLQEKLDALHSVDDLDEQIESLKQRAMMLREQIGGEIAGVAESLAVVQAPTKPANISEPIGKYKDMELLPAVLDVIQTSERPRGLASAEIFDVLEQHGFTMSNFFPINVYFAALQLAKEGKIEVTMKRGKSGKTRFLDAHRNAPLRQT